ncbi:DNA utilization protein GntX (plasmid) [Tsukamurella tyrosinosolvens]|uniref:Predicted amidophosphoribosyltransferases n=1 Tax=Tsukamurella tyrosinosolvens TaxID=57704 RepID=A0A1H4Z1H7_TSUTY|nr:phosphoribosyltransferase family protein [Tsukamurella tyrosinosolvens]WEL92390.1 phosphoribosyltransferase family protein [Tsukamurella tyrosinosolvens]SED24059.1 Predicted amidophosphoribosyltransferases [Tsukamurella tyrosinosolvens]VEH91235.1 DNA utilization protein GntX [Tsukamurella tyrosinosolvens]
MRVVRSVVRGVAGGVDDLVELAVPRTCGGCGFPRVRWCARCEAALHDVPALIRTTVPVGVPVWTLGRYDGARRRAVLQLKERGRGDLAVPLGRGLAHAVLRLRAWGEVDGPLVLIPAPTTAWAARRRGGDVVTAVCRAAARTAEPVCAVTVAPVLRSVGAAESVGLSASARAANVRGTVRVRGVPPAGTVVLVDDVVTTGATLAESVAALARRGVAVAAALTFAAA